MLSEFRLTKQQLKVLQQLGKPGESIHIEHGTLETYWVYNSNPGLKRIKLAHVEVLRGYGLVEVYLDPEGAGKYGTGHITLSGERYLQSLEVSEEERLDLDKLRAVHRLVYGIKSKDDKKRTL